ncbi:unnamed protein product [Rhodiola kirilowii]
MALEEIRKGPWTEQEDCLLANVVSLFGDRRWDFVAKVSGLNRTGKSCRLRWVNYLHPGLKRGKMTAQEERLIVELHAKWGNRWSRIARKLPGRTDNEIKNYWRTHMRKKAQEQKKTTSRSIELSDSSSSSNPTTDSLSSYTEKVSFYDSGGHDAEFSFDGNKQAEEIVVKGYSMDDIWKNIDMTSEKPISQLYEDFSEGSNLCCSPPISPMWDYCSGPLWKMEDEARHPATSHPPDHTLADHFSSHQIRRRDHHPVAPEPRNSQPGDVVKTYASDATGKTAIGKKGEKPEATAGMRTAARERAKMEGNLAKMKINGRLRSALGASGRD